MRRRELSAEERASIEPLPPRKSRGAPRVDDRRVINGILWRFRTGAPWRGVPERYGPRTTLYDRFVRWRAAGVWDRLLDAVSEACDGDIVMIDSSCARVRQHGAAAKGGPEAGGDRCTGRSRGGLTTRVHALVDAEGRPVKLALAAGQAGDAPAAEQTPPLAAPLIAGRAYDTGAIRDACAEEKARANIPPRITRKDSLAFSPWVCRQRSRVERFINRIKQFRGLATGYDRSPDNFLAALKLAAIRIRIATK